MVKVWIWLKRSGIGITAAALMTVPVSMLLWQYRDPVQAIDLPVAEPTETGADAVTVTWLGATSLLFDDGDTQVLVDGFLSRPDILDILLRRPIVSDAANINYVLNEFDIRRLAAIVPTHSHYDHAMDVGAIANRTSASVIGTESTANIARGAHVPSDQIVLATNGDSFAFGEFTITLVTSRHVPNGFGDGHLVAGFMAEPIRQPAVFTEWREGGSWSIVVGHPKGTTLVQGSAGFIDQALAEVQADVVMLSVAGLKRQGPAYAGEYWRQVVESTGARRVLLIHHDDFTQPFGEVRLLPKVLDDVVTSAQWLAGLAAAREDPVDLLLPPFGDRVSLY